MTDSISARLRALSYHIDETGLVDDVDAKSCTEAADHIDAQDAKIAALVDALSKLCFEVAGLQAFEQGVRHEIGNTNYSAIMTRLNDGGVAIAAAKDTT